MRQPSSRKVLEDEQCCEIVKKKLLRDDMKDYSMVNYEMVPMDSSKGYMGQYFTLKVTVACPESPLDTRDINFFTKIPPPSSSPQYEYMQTYGSFKKEVDLYTLVFPEVFDDGDNLRYVPQCFLGVPNDVIVLEDMAHSGYEMTSKHVPFDLEHSRIMMKTLARFHAKSLTFEELNKKNLHDEFSDCMRETLWPLEEGRSMNMFNAAVKGTLSLIRQVERLTENEKNDLCTKLKDLTTNHAVKLRPSEKYKNVLCHGDLWANNILFKYNSEKKPVECCLIDFQLVRYNPPAHDLLCFLYFTTKSQLREKHGLELYKIYHETMCEALEASGLDATSVFSWDDFLQSIEDLRTMCMTHSVLNIPIMLLEESAANKYFSQEPELLESMLYEDRTPLICAQFDEVPAYRDRMEDAIIELHNHLTKAKV